ADHAGVVLERLLHALLELADPEHLGEHPGQPLAVEIRHLGSFRARVRQSTVPSSAPTTAVEPCADRQLDAADCALFAKKRGAEPRQDRSSRPVREAVGGRPERWKEGSTA